MKRWDPSILSVEDCYAVVVLASIGLSGDAPAKLETFDRAVMNGVTDLELATCIQRNSAHGCHPDKRSSTFREQEQRVPGRTTRGEVRMTKSGAAPVDVGALNGQGMCSVSVVRQDIWPRTVGKARVARSRRKKEEEERKGRAREAR